MLMINLNSLYSAVDLSNYRSLISIKGPDSSVYLQNLITNDIRTLNENDKKSLFAMILNNKGRIMYDVLVYLKEANDHEYLVELDTRFTQDALKLFKMLKVKKKVLIDLPFEKIYYISIKLQFLHIKP